MRPTKTTAALSWTLQGLAAAILLQTLYFKFTGAAESRFIFQTIGLEPVVKVGNAAVGIGAGGTILLGIWLAISLDEYQLWDGWVIAALLLWVAAAAVGRRTGVAFMQGMQRAQELDAAGQPGPNAELLALNRTQTGVVMHAATTVIVLLIILDMIWKPGA